MVKKIIHALGVLLEPAEPNLFIIKMYHKYWGHEGSPSTCRSCNRACKAFIQGDYRGTKRGFYIYNYRMMNYQFPKQSLVRE